MSLPSKILFHYTSASGLLGIFNSSSIWVSQLQYMNDHKEFAYAVDLALGAIHQRITKCLDKKHQNVCYEVGEYLKRLNPIIYIACFSEDDDSLNQWRSYCQPNLGYNIGFDVDRLHDIANSLGFSLRPCIYEIDTQKYLITEWVNRLIDDFLSRAPQDIRPEQFCQSNMNDYATDFCKFAPFFKHPSFKEEREWRLVSPVGYMHRNAILRAGKSSLIPYHKIDIKLNSVDSPVFSITVGPTINIELSSSAIWNLVKDLPKTISWAQSNIPYRDW